MKRLYTVLCFLTLGLFSSYGQDTQFSQFYAAPTLLNPAFAGTGDYARLVFNYRNQWPELNKAFTTYSAAYDMQNAKLHGGVGLGVMSDVIGAGDLVANQMHVMYSYILQINHEWTLSLGAQASVIQTVLNWNKLIFPDMIDPVKGAVLQTGQQSPDDGTKHQLVDFTAGAALFSRNFYLGLATHHLARPKTSYYNNEVTQLERNYMLQAGYVFDAAKEHGKVTLAYYPGIIIQKQGEMKQINYGFYAKNEMLVGGLWYRQNFNMKADALIFLAGLYFKSYKISYSYDLPLSSIYGHAYSSHEATLSILFSKPASHIRMEAIPCPDF